MWTWNVALDFADDLFARMEVTPVYDRVRNSQTRAVAPLSNRVAPAGSEEPMPQSMVRLLAAHLPTDQTCGFFVTGGLPSRFPSTGSLACTVSLRVAHDL